MKVFIFVRKELVPVVNFTFEGHGKVFRRFFIEDRGILDARMGDTKEAFLLIMDSNYGGIAPEQIKDIKKQYPTARILYLIDSETKKADLVDLITTRTIRKAILKPFTAQQLLEGIYDISIYQKPDEQDNVFAKRLHVKF